jgi:protein-S-isoprenylcysteine O-methyltransferase Ste14
MTRALLMAIAILCYCAFFVAFVYLVGFVGNLPGWPLTVDRGQQVPVGTAAMTDLALIALFGVQHTVMARPGFKAAWTRLVPQPIERSIFCLAAALTLGVMFSFWRPILAIVWDVENGYGRVFLWGLFGLGWLIVFISTWLINHFELFGLAQPWRHLRRIDAPKEIFRTPGFYRAIRHPIYAGFFLAFWFTPTMTTGHLLLAAGLSVYMLIGIRFEERDLIVHFGQQYVEYRERVAMLIPGLGRR